MAIYDIEMRIEIEGKEPLEWLDSLLNENCTGKVLQAYQIEKIKTPEGKVVWVVKEKDKLPSIY